MQTSVENNKYETLLSKACPAVWSLNKSKSIRDGSFWITRDGSVYSVENHDPSAGRLLDYVGRNNLPDVSMALAGYEGDETTVILIGNFVAVKIVSGQDFMGITFPESVSPAQVRALSLFESSPDRMQGEQIRKDGERPTVVGFDAIQRTMSGLDIRFEELTVIKCWKGDGD